MTRRIAALFGALLLTLAVAGPTFADTTNSDQVF